MTDSSIELKDTGYRPKEKTPQRSSKEIQFVFVNGLPTRSKLESLLPSYDIRLGQKPEKRLVHTGYLKTPSGENIPLYEVHTWPIKYFDSQPTGALVSLKERTNGESVRESCHGNCDTALINGTYCQHFLGFVQTHARTAPTDKPIVVAGCTGPFSHTRGGQRWISYYTKS